MRCSECGSTVRRQKGPYRYVGCGLPDVYLKNVKWSKCDGCQDVTVEMPRVGQLHRCLASYVVFKDSFLTGPEIVFLRKMLRKTQRAMAKDLGVSEVALNRWENGARGHTKAMDTFLRLFYLTLQDDEYTHEVNQRLREKIVTYFGSIKKSEPQRLSIEIDPRTCSVEDVIRTAISERLAS